MHKSRESWDRRPADAGAIHAGQDRGFRERKLTSSEDWKDCSMDILLVFPC